MLNYTVHIHIRKTREEEWKEYMIPHIKKVLNTGHFLDCNFRKFAIPEALDPDGNKADPDFAQYVIEYLCPSKTELDRYEANGARGLRAEHRTFFEGDFKAFRRDHQFQDLLMEYFLRTAEKDTSAEPTAPPSTELGAASTKARTGDTSQLHHPQRPS